MKAVVIISLVPSEIILTFMECNLMSLTLSFFSTYVKNEKVSN